VDTLLDHVKKSNFPWLLSNILDIETNEPLAGSKLQTIIKFNDLKVKKNTTGKDKKLIFLN
jgi:hypothetical protein